MALFKQLRGPRAFLDAEPLRDGYAYFCVDDGTFHIDYKDSKGNLHRKQINAKEAESLIGCDITAAKIEQWDATVETVKSLAGGSVDFGSMPVAKGEGKDSIIQVSETENDEAIIALEGIISEGEHTIDVYFRDTFRYYLSIDGKESGSAVVTRRTENNFIYAVKSIRYDGDPYVIGNLDDLISSSVMLESGKKYYLSAMKVKPLSDDSIYGDVEIEITGSCEVKLTGDDEYSWSVAGLSWSSKTGFSISGDLTDGIWAVDIYRKYDATEWLCYPFYYQSIDEHSGTLYVLGDVTNYSIYYYEGGLDNKASTEGAVALGKGNRAGAKGYYYSHIFNDAVVLTNTQGIPTLHTTSIDSVDTYLDSTIEHSYRFGDEISLINGSKYYNCGMITEVNNNVIFVDWYASFTIDGINISLPFDAISEMPEGDMNTDDYGFFVIKNSNVGDNDITTGAFVAGENTIGTGRASFGGGRANIGYGDYATYGGRENEASYATAVFGLRNKALANGSAIPGGQGNVINKGALHSFAGGYFNTIGTDVKGKGDSSAVFGKNNYVEAASAFAACQSNSVYALGGAAFGSNNIINPNASNSLVAGNGNTLNADDTAVFGQGNISYSKHGLMAGYKLLQNNTVNNEQIVIGKRNAAVDNAYFVVGGGPNEATRHNVLVLGTDGNLTLNGAKATDGSVSGGNVTAKTIKAADVEADRVQASDSINAPKISTDNIQSSGSITGKTLTVENIDINKIKVNNPNSTSVSSSFEMLSSGTSSVNNTLPRFLFGNQINLNATSSTSPVVAMGRELTVNADGSSTFGAKNTANSRFGFIGGYSNTTSADVTNQTAFGKYSQEIGHDTLPNEKGVDKTVDAAFFLGNGTSSKKSNAVVIYYDGRIRSAHNTHDYDPDDVLVNKGYLKEYVKNIIENLELWDGGKY